MYNFDEKSEPFSESATKMYNGTHCYIFVKSLHKNMTTLGKYHGYGEYKQKAGVPLFLIRFDSFGLVIGLSFLLVTELLMFS